MAETNPPPAVGDHGSPQPQSTVNPFEHATATPPAESRSTADQPGDVLEHHNVPPPPSTNHGSPVNALGDSPAPPTEHVPPEVEALKAMFPDFDVAILQSVLESVNGDQERAINTLLSMNDPNYVSQEAQHQEPPMTQTELDEQFARRLMLEEQEQQQREAPAQGLPYQPRVPRDRHQWSGQAQGPQGGQSGRDTMAEVSEQFNKIAESGKRTFSSLFTKVKAKIQEYDQQRQGASQSNYSQYDPDWPHNEASANSGYNRQSQPQPDYIQGGHGRGDYSTPINQAPVPPPRMQGYDATPPPASRAANPPASISAGGPTANPSAAYSPPSNPPPAPSPVPVGIDRTKLGLLPKRPVSLVEDTPAQGARRHDTEDDELDYVENPFEEERRT